MNTIALNLTEGSQGTSAGELAFWVVTFSLLPVALLFGVMAFLMLFLAAGLAAIVWARPQEAPGAGMLFLFAAGILLPSASRADNTLEAWEMYYWAVGLLIITLAAVTRLGLRRVFAVPLSAKVFLGVALASAIYAEAHGAATSYVLRQFYGILLLVIYLGIALHVGDGDLLLRRTQTFGVLCVFCFLVYYIAVFGELGFHKEIGSNGEQANLLAIVLFITGVERRKYQWVLGALALLLVPILLFHRADVLIFLTALPIALGMKLKSKKLKLLCYSGAALIAMPAVFPPVTEIVGQQLSAVPVVGSMIPESAQDVRSMYDRTLQIEGALNTVRAHPWLGAGLGSIFQWDSPFQGLVEEGFVDSGWAYLLQKMGLLGVAAFLWFLATLLRRVSAQSIGLSACLLSVTFVALISQPTYFHFMTAPFMGTFAGLLLAGQKNKSLGNSPCSSHLAVPERKLPRDRISVLER
jgi:hypothetical protein